MTTKKVKLLMDLIEEIGLTDDENEILIQSLGGRKHPPPPPRRRRP